MWCRLLDTGSHDAQTNLPLTAMHVHLARLIAFSRLAADHSKSTDENAADVSVFANRVGWSKMGERVRD